jgi:plasmid replication initiation protein
MATPRTQKSYPPVKFPKPKEVSAIGNPLIESSFRMEANELKLLIFVCSFIHEEHDFFTYSFTVEQAAKAFGRKYDREHQSFYTDLKRWSKSIVGRTIELPDFIPQTGAKPRDRQTTIFDYFDYINGEARVEVVFKNWLKPYLLDLKREFTRIAVREITQLQSFYGLKLFMLLSQYSKFKRRKFALKDLRFALGVEDGIYPEWGEFDRRVIKIAINDLRRANILEVESIPYKRGRKVFEVEFRFYKPGSERDETPTKKDQEEAILIAQNMIRFQEILMEEKDLFDTEEANQRAIKRLLQEIKQTKNV